MDYSKKENKNKIENFERYLAELSKENPQKYKKLISDLSKKNSNNDKIKLKENENEDENEFKTTIIKPKTYMCLRFKIIDKIIEKEIKKDKILIQEIPDILFSYTWDNNSFSNKIKEEPKVYLNIIYSDKFSLPLDENKGKLLNVENFNEWKIIPTEFRYNKKKLCMSGKRCDYYDVILNEIVISTIEKNEILRNNLLSFIVGKFFIFLNNKYELYTKEVKILKNKRYKSINPHPEDFIFKEKIIIIKKEFFDENEFISAKNFFDIPENKINIPSVSENMTNTPYFYNLNPNKSNKKNENNNINTQINKPLIEEISKNTKKYIDIKKKIIDNNRMEIKFILDNFNELNNIDDIDLQVSENGIKLNIIGISLDEYEPIDMIFNYNVDADKCVASFEKKNKILKLILFKN
jgi:hypothetical protein